MPTPCESWPRRLASTRLAATCDASPACEPAAATMARTAAASASARKVKVSVMAARSAGWESPKRNKSPRASIGHRPVAQSNPSSRLFTEASMRYLTALALVAVATSLPSLAAAETTKILQQRTPDGSILLTDQPSPGAKTERSWQVSAPDRAAERQRAIDVKAEANLVSERIQRSLDSQRRADDEAQRMRLAYLQLERDRAAGASTQDGISYGNAGGYGWTTPFRASRKP